MKDTPLVLSIRPPVQCYMTVYPVPIPLGFFSVLSMLSRNGYRVAFVDFFGNERKKQFDKVPPPAVLSHYSRPYYRFGRPIKEIEQDFDLVSEFPAVILVTSGITFWYLGLVEVLEVCRRRFPGVPVILGGIYATIWRNHALTLGFDDVLSGEGENAVVDYLDRLTGFCTSYRVNPKDLDSYPLPAWGLTGGLRDFNRKGVYLPYLSTRGCPFNCSYCASKTIYTFGYRRRSPHLACSQIEQLVRDYKVHGIYFQDDQLLLDSEKHIKPLIRLLRDSRILKKTRFYTHNSMDASMVDYELACLLRESRFPSVYLSIEVLDPAEQKKMGRNPKTEDFIKAIGYLHEAGFSDSEIVVYILMGLPGQSRRAVAETMAFVWSLGAVPTVLTFTPIPSTAEWDRSVKAGYWSEDSDPVQFDLGLVPCQSEGLTYQDAVKLRKHAMYIRRDIMGGAHFFGPHRVDRDIKDMMMKYAYCTPTEVEESEVCEETRKEGNVPVVQSLGSPGVGKGYSGRYFRLAPDSVQSYGLRGENDPFMSIDTVWSAGLPVSRRSLRRYDDILHPVEIGGSRKYSIASLRVLEEMLRYIDTGGPVCKLRAYINELKASGALPDPVRSPSR